jgi:hypothetical protein
MPDDPAGMNCAANRRGVKRVLTANVDPILLAPPPQGRTRKIAPNSDPTAGKMITAAYANVAEFREALPPQADEGLR